MKKIVALTLLISCTFGFAAVALAQPSVRTMPLQWQRVNAGSAILSPRRGLIVAAQTDEQALQDGAEWLMTQQNAHGAYPWEVGGPISEDTQGTTARGMLVAYEILRDSSYLDSARKTGDYLVNTPPRRFSDGDPDIAPLDVLFLEELSLITGDSQYADFLQTNLWSKLAAGTYGEHNDQNCAEWAETIPVFEDFSHWTAMEPVYRAMPALAAHYAGEVAHREDLLNSVIKKLEETGANDRDGDLTGIAGSIQASAHTGRNLDPQTGRWAEFDSTQDFVDFLVSYQRHGGDWPYDTSVQAAFFVGDVSTTSWAVMALKAWDPERYAENIRKGLDFIKAQQQSNGQILTNPGAPANTTAGVEVHGEALVAIGTDDCTLYDAASLPPNQAPLAEDDSAETVEDWAVVINVLTNDRDPDGTLDPSSVTVLRAPGNGQTQVNDTTGAITYTPAAGFSGEDSFDYIVRDDRGAVSNAATVFVTVAAQAGGVTKTFTPIADTYISQSSTSRNYGTSNELQFRQRTGRVYLPYLKFEVTGLGGVVQSARLRLFVENANNETGTLYLGSNYYANSTNPWTETGLTWNNADRNNTAIASLAPLPDNAWIEFDVTATVTGEGTYTFNFQNNSSSTGVLQPREGANPPQLILRVNDDGVNQPPSAVDDAATTSAGTPVEIAVLANDRDPDGTLATASVAIVREPTHGSASANSSGTITYTPAEGFAGTDTLTYSVEDNEGARSNTATVSITVHAEQSVFTFVPIADTYVSQSQPAANFGSVVELRSQRQNFAALLTYLKFQVTNLNGTIQRARLRLYTTSGANDAGTLYSASNNYAGSSTAWQESGLNWNNADKNGTVIASTSAAIASNSWIELEISAHVTAEGTYSFAFINSTSQVDVLSAREGANPPELIVETSAQAAAAPTKSATHKAAAHAALLATEGATSATEFRLEPNYPNPFNLETTITYHLPQAARVRLAVYNSNGQQVRTLVDDWQVAGVQRLVWDGRDDVGGNLSTGVYFVQLRAQTQTRSIKLLLVK